MLNPFSGDAFGTIALTAAINILPNRYGVVRDMNLMPARAVRFRQIAVEERNGVLSLLPTAQVGAPGTVGVRAKRKVRSFIIPHIPHDDVILPSEVQGIRRFGSEGDLVALSDVMAMHLEAVIPRPIVELRLADIGIDPMEGDEVQVEGFSYRILDVQLDGHGAVVLVLNRNQDPFA